MTRRLVERPAQIFSTSLGGTIRPKYPFTNLQNGTPGPEKKITITVIKAGLLIPGDGTPIRDAALVITDKLISWIGPQSDIPSQYTSPAHRSYTVPYLMPGLWDCHAHFMMGSPDDAGNNDPYLGFVTEHPAAAGARLTRACWLALQRGYTSMRDVAGLGCEISRVINEGTIVGPNVYSSGACLSQTAGHGDVFSLPAGDVLLNLGVSQVTAGHFGTGPSMLVDGVDECRRAVRLQIRRGAKCIKILASGGVMSRDDNPMYAQFSPEELQCIVEEATRQGRAVAAHVHGKPGILAAVKAGVTTVEHVSFADQECIDLIQEKGTIYVATRMIMDLLLDSGGEGIPKHVWEKAKLCAENHLVAYQMAIKAGIPIALGTDTGPGFNMAMELEAAVKAGMSNLEAIKAATANGPLSVGIQAPKTGQLKVGYEADVIGVLENPVEDVKVLQKIDNIGWVWKGGKIYKGPGVGPWGESEWSGE
ncbi:amidohydrolase [Colletotrichum truncatum]|uniref:Amidohydrolase n=1 Tax=Colletotrichum truncatum TaxID=5467 RepID=A0ACC3YKY6_COLTU|nr:amidohydrolase [Colletotrichum truncatum]KAF6782850.1 amidohydrolase [Colletotrichum truncatum]